MPRILLATLALGLAGCAAQPLPTGTAVPTPTHAASPSSPAPEPPASPRPTPSAIPLPGQTSSTDGQVGLPSTGCVNGWQSPAPGTPLYEEGRALVPPHIQPDAIYGVLEMRYFTGPEAPWIIEPRPEVVERWYIKGSLDNGTDAGRWLVEKRSDVVKGVSAVAPFDSSGFRSPDWVGFVGDGSPSIYPGLPGSWPGIPYDFVTGEGDSGQPGLPPEVVDCLAGT